MSDKQLHKLGIDIGSTTVKIAILDSQDNILFSDYERHFANIQETLASLIAKASNELGDLSVSPVITGSGGLTLAKHLEVPFTQEVLQYPLLSLIMRHRPMLQSSSAEKMPRSSILKAVMSNSV